MGEAAPNPAEFHFVQDARSVALLLDEELYPLDAVYGAAYLFVDRAWLFLDRPGDKQVNVRLRLKEVGDDDDDGRLEALAGEFANELLNQVLRKQVGEATKRLREYTLARAFFGDSGRVSIDALLAELDAEELADDPLEIAVPWLDAPSDAPQDPATQAPGTDDAGG